MSERPTPLPLSPDMSKALTTSVEAIPFAVLDLETTGLSPARDEILAVGAVHMHGSRILVGRTFYRLISPQQRRWDETVQVHRLRPADVLHAPPASQVLSALWQFCHGRVIAGYRIDLDRRFLVRLSPQGDAWQREHLWLDVHRLAVWLERERSRWPWRQPTVTLETLAQRYGLTILQRHHALGDAFLTAQILQRQLLAARGHGLHSLGDLLRVAGV